MKLADLELLRRNISNISGVLGRDRYPSFAVLIPLVFLNGEYHFLFERRASNIRQAGEVCFPGGKFDSKMDLDLSKTAVRETVEELGLAEEKIKIEGRLGSLLAAMGALIDVFWGRLDISSLSELRTNSDEVDEVFLVPVSFFENTKPEEYGVRVIVQPSYAENHEEIVLLPAKELGLPERYHQPWGGVKHKVFIYKTDNGVIWGLTADIIKEVIKLLKGRRDL